MDRSQLAGVPSAPKFCQLLPSFPARVLHSLCPPALPTGGTCLTYTQSLNFAQHQSYKNTGRTDMPAEYIHPIHTYKERHIHIFILNQSAAQQSLSPAPTPDIKDPPSTWQQVKNLNDLEAGGVGRGGGGGNSSAPAQYANFCECFTYLFYLLFVCLFLLLCYVCFQFQVPAEKKYQKVFRERRRGRGGHYTGQPSPVRLRFCLYSL